MTPKEALQRAYEATGTGEWVFADGRTPNATEGRYRVFRYLVNAGLSKYEVENITGWDRSSVYWAMKLEPRSFVNPTDSFRRAMRGRCPSIWTRVNGNLFRSAWATQARLEVYVAMRADGCSQPEIARVTGGRAHTGVCYSLSRMRMPRVRRIPVRGEKLTTTCGPAHGCPAEKTGTLVSNRRGTGRNSPKPSPVALVKTLPGRERTLVSHQRGMAAAES